MNSSWPNTARARVQKDQTRRKKRKPVIIRRKKCRNESHPQERQVKTVRKLLKQLPRKEENADHLVVSTGSTSSTPTKYLPTTEEISDVEESLQDSVGSELREKVSLRADELQDELLQDSVGSVLREDVSLRADELQDDVVTGFRRK